MLLWHQDIGFVFMTQHSMAGGGAARVHDRWARAVAGGFERIDVQGTGTGSPNRAEISREGSNLVGGRASSGFPFASLRTGSSTAFAKSGSLRSG